MLKINGEEREYPGTCTLLEFLEREGYRPERLAVERNGEIVPRALLGGTQLEDGDILEVVSFVGGG